MNIINTIKNYFKNNENKINMSLSSSDNVLLKEKLEMLDLKIKELENLAQGTINLTKNRHYVVDSSNNPDLGSTEFDLCISNNIVYMSGRLASKHQLNGQYYLDLPINVRPKTSYVGYWSNIIVDGVNYKFHINVERANPNRLVIFSYDNFPANASIVFNLTYPLDYQPN